MQQFLDALEDRDSFVRAAAARELGDYRDNRVTDALQGAFDDPKPVVRLMAAASYIRASQPVPVRQKPHRSGTVTRNSTRPR
jgi:HEAT repeat protein